MSNPTNEQRLAEVPGNTCRDGAGAADTDAEDSERDSPVDPNEPDIDDPSSPYWPFIITTDGG
jgi:hypothetical protein